MRVIDKVVAYVTWGERLLVFSQPEYPEAGVQVPAGTLKDGEAPEAGVLREVEEETGLSELALVSYLGARKYKLGPITGEKVVVKRHYFHLRYVGESPKDWRHFEMDPSGEAEGPIEFKLYWVEYRKGVPELSGELGDLLHLLPASA